MTGLVVAFCGAGVGLGLVGLARASTGDRSENPSQRSDSTGRPGWAALIRARGPLLVAALGGGLAAGWATGWAVAVPLVGLAVIGLPRLFGRTSGSVSIAKVEAIASWTEMLQGTLAASAGLGQAIMVTAPLSPPPVREAALRLSSRLNAGSHPAEALAQFADEVADPSADRVVCALQLAVTNRAQRLGDLLVALADTTREDVALRLRIETSRASVRSGVRTVLVFSVAFAVGLTVFGHAYLSPFGSAQGQVVLALVGTLYAVGLSLLVSLSRPPAPVRLLGDKVER